MKKKLFGVIFFVLNLVLSVLWIVQGKAYMMVNDDLAIMGMLKHGDHQTLTLSPITSVAMVYLYRQFSEVPFYSIFLFASLLFLVLAAFLVLKELLLRCSETHRLGGILSFTAFSINLVSYNALFLSATTLTVSFLAVVMFLNIMTKFKYWWLVLPALFMRFDVFIYVPAVLSPLFLYFIMSHQWDRILIKRLCLLGGLCLVLLKVGEVTYSDEYKYWLKFNHARAYFHNFNFPPKQGSPIAQGQVSEIKLKSIRYDWWHFDDELTPAKEIIASAEPYYMGALRYLQPRYGLSEKKALLSVLTTLNPQKLWLYFWLIILLTSLLLPFFSLKKRILFVTASIISAYFLFTLLVLRNTQYMTPGLLASLTMVSLGVWWREVEKKFFPIFFILLIGFTVFFTYANWNLYNEREQTRMRNTQAIKDFKSLRKLEPDGLWLPSINYPLKMDEDIFVGPIFNENLPSLYSNDKGLIPAGWMVRHPFTQERICPRLYNKERCEIKTMEFLSNERVYFYGVLPVNDGGRYFLTYFKEKYGCDYNIEVTHQIEGRAALAQIKFQCPDSKVK